MQTLIWKKIYAPHVHYIIYNSHDMGAISVSIDRWMGKEDVVDIDIEWNITWPLKGMKSCHLQEHGWT